MSDARVRYFELKPNAREIAVAWIRDKCGEDVACPACKASDWRPGSDVAMLPLAAFSDQGYPMVAIACQNCGFIMLFDALTIGAAVDSKLPGENAPDAATSETPDAD